MRLVLCSILLLVHSHPAQTRTGQWRTRWRMPVSLCSILLLVHSHHAQRRTRQWRMPASVRSWCPSTRVGGAPVHHVTTWTEKRVIGFHLLQNNCQNNNYRLVFIVLATVYTAYCILSVYTITTGEDETVAAPQVA